MIAKSSIARINSIICSALLLVSFSTQTNARQLDDVSMPDNVTLAGTDVVLQLNGMGYRTKFIFDIYVGALYTEAKVDSRDAAQALQGPKRIVMHMVYDEVSKEKMAAAWQEGFEENNSDEQLEKLQSRLKAFISQFPTLKKDDVVFLDYIPGVGTRLTINGEKVTSVEGADFYVALLDVWLGEEPADDDLKDAMLGEDDD